MKVIGINGSARKDGNTAILIKHAFTELEAEGIHTELIQLAQASRCTVVAPATTASRARTSNVASRLTLPMNASAK